MASISKDITLPEYSAFVNTVYGIPNDRSYTHWDMLSYIERFSMRAIKGIRKENSDKVRLNIMISFIWYTSLMNRLHVNLDEMVWRRFPYKCSYCGEAPCVCKAEKIETRKNVTPDHTKKPERLRDFQYMFDTIYPAANRTPKDAGIHLAEETGELSEAIQIYMGDRNDENLENVTMEAADYFSCIMGVLNSLDINLADELAATFTNNCHVCHDAPCTCTFKSISSFKS